MTGDPPQRGLLDTSTVVLLPRLRDPAVLPPEPLISTITLAELSVGPLVATSDDERARRQAEVQQAESDFDPIPFDRDAAHAFARVSMSLRSSGRTTKARGFDALIASVAMANHLRLFTCNPNDFEGIDDLDVVPIPHPDAEAD